MARFNYVENLLILVDEKRQISIFRVRLIKYTTLNEKGQNGALKCVTDKGGENGRFKQRRTGKI